MEAKMDPRVVLVHDWLTGMRGGEKCLEILCRRWPDAELFTLLHKRGAVSPSIENRAISTSFLQTIPRIDRYYRYLLPLMPAAVKSWRIPRCDVVLSLSHCAAKAVRPPAGVPHVCYCFTPMRYAWHQQNSYFNDHRLGRLPAKLVDAMLGMMRRWDRATAERVTHFIAISRTVQRRIQECYDRVSTVIYPPVDTDFYHPAPVEREDYYLVVSAFAPYKRIDLAIEACNRLSKRLVIIGRGQDANRLKQLAGPKVTFLGWQPDEVIRDHFRRCRALLFPGEEDFGIVPVEAQACGAPVIAFDRGGATETVVPLGSRTNATGIWFEEQSADCLVTAMKTLEANSQEFDPGRARRQALRFRQSRFEAELFDFVDRVLSPRNSRTRRAA